MTLNKLAEKVMPPLLVLAIVVGINSVMELRAVSVQVKDIATAIDVYHPKRQGETE